MKAFVLSARVSVAQWFMFIFTAFVTIMLGMASAMRPIALPREWEPTITWETIIKVFSNLHWTLLGALEGLRISIGRHIIGDVGGIWRVKLVCRKYNEDINAFIAAGGTSEEFHRKFIPYETIVRHRNGLLNVGINLLWSLLAGGAGQAFTNAVARIGVGASSTGFNASQTDLQDGSTPSWKAMVTSYPTYGTSQLITFMASWGSGDANIAWNEWAVDNGGTAHVLLNRKVESLGTKTTGTWTLTVQISLS